MRRMKKHIALLFTAVLSVCTFMSNGLTVSADEAFEKTADNTMFGTAGMASPRLPLNDTDGWQGSYVYYGKYAGKPVKYRVLDKETTDFNEAGNTNPTMLLDCDESLLFSEFDKGKNLWGTSYVKELLNGIFLNNNVFSGLEKESISGSYKLDRNSNDGKDIVEYMRSTSIITIEGGEWKEDFVKLEGEKIFLLDLAEARRTSYGYPDHAEKTPIREKKDGSIRNDFYMLRNRKSVYVLRITETGYVSFGYTDSKFGVSPAFNVDLSHILFSSAVKGDKDKIGTEYKLTLATDMFSSEIKSGEKVIALGNNVCIPYVVTGTNANKANAMSVLVLDGAYNAKAGNNNSANILYYGKLDTGDTFSESGTGTCTLPGSFDLEKWGSDYRVYLLTEQVNGSQETDYASFPVEIKKSDLEIKQGVTVKFNANGHGETPASQRIEKGTKVVKPDDPTADGYLFKGWYTNATCTGSAFDFNTDVTANITLYAKWVSENCTVTFDLRGGVSSQPEAQTMRYGDSAVKPTDPTREGYVFGGWYTDSFCKSTSKYSFATHVENDITLYAKWLKICTVSFDANGGTGTMNPVHVTEGDYYELPECGFESPAIDKAFSRWYCSDDATNKSPGYKKQITNNITLKAQWKQLDYKTVTFSSLYGVIDPMKVKNGEKVTKPDDPVHEEYTFLGWYTKPFDVNKANDDSLFDFDTPITKDITLYGCWRNDSFYHVNAKEASYDKGGKVVVDKNLAQTGDHVTITITPDEGFELDYLDKVPYQKDEFNVDDKKVLASECIENTYSFEMPNMSCKDYAYERDVLIYVHFKPTHEHKWEHHKSVSNTCTDKGFRGYAQCTVCGRKYNYSDEEKLEVNTQYGDCTDETDESRTVGPFHLDVESVDAKIPNCKESGNLKYWHCKACDKYWLNNNMPEETECTLEDTYLPIDPDAHVWDEETTSYEWSEDNREVTGSYTCKLDPSHKVRETVKTNETFTTAPTCTDNGIATLTSDEFSNAGLEVQTKTGIPVKALGHDWGEPEYKWADDYSTCTATVTCKRDESHKETETVTAKEWNTGNYKIYTAEFMKKLFDDQVINIAEVTFNMNGKEAIDIPKIQLVEVEKNAVKPSDDPKVKDGNKFGGWFMDEECKEHFDFNAPISENTVIYAKWVPDATELFTVTYDLNGIAGTAPSPQLVENGGTATESYEPKAENFIFTGWYVDKAGVSKYDFTAPVTDNITLYAGWNKDEKCNVTFDKNGKDDATDMPTAIVVQKGEAVAEPTEIPKLEGFTFTGWYKEAECTNKFDFSVPVTENITLYAGWKAIPVYSVTFDMNGKTASDIPANQTVQEGKSAVEPSTVPKAEGFKFGGWYKEAECSNHFDFAEEIKENTVIYAKWVAVDTELFTVTFDLNGKEGTVPTVQLVEKNGKATVPAEPKVEGFTFTGWYKEAACTNVFDFATPVTENTTVYAGWKKIEATSYTVSFETNGGSSVAAVKVESGGKVAKPVEPTKEGYTFAGWFADNALTKEYDFGGEVSSDIILYAKWNKKDDGNGGDNTEDNTEGSKQDGNGGDNSESGQQGGNSGGGQEGGNTGNDQTGGNAGGNTGNDQTGGNTADNTRNTPSGETTSEPKVGDTVTDETSNTSYSITNNDSSGMTVTYVTNNTTNVTNVTVPDEVNIKNKKYKVTEIAPNAFKNNKNLKKITIGKNIEKIGKNAFYGCKNLKKVIIKTTKLTKNSVGKNAFKGIHKKAKVKVPKKKLKSYKKILKGVGIKGKKQKIMK